MNAFVRAGLIALLLLAGQPGLAQTGAAPPRMVQAALPLEGPRPGSVTTGMDEPPRIVEVALSVDADGRVTDVAIRESFGDSRFDEQVLRYYRKLRLVPALDKLGVPTTGSVKSTYVVPGDARIYPYAQFPMGDVVFEDVPFPKHDFSSSGADVSRKVIYDERARIRHMSCGDFLWEYDLMLKIAGDAGERALENERPMIDAIGMFMAAREPRGQEILWVQENQSNIIRATVAKCRANRALSYWEGVVEPTMKAMITK